MQVLPGIAASLLQFIRKESPSQALALGCQEPCAYNSPITNLDLQVD